VTDRPTATAPPPGTDAADTGAAAAPSDAPGPSVTASAPVPTAGRGTRRQQRRLIIVGAVLVAAFVFLIVKGIGSSLDYFETVDQAVQSKAMLGTKTFRLEGLVVPGSVHRSHGDVDFVAAGTKDRIDVVNSTNPPQLFQADIPVVVVGHFDGATFISNQIIVDHTAQYVAKYPKRVRAPNGTTR
jgi:cytochrome c-type biogenesis protein CcmE